jgi:hypothetical protein
MLAGCGGHASNGAVPINGNPDSAPSQRTFHYTGGEQHFTVPLRVTHITVVARGAKGAGYRGPDGGSIIGTFGVPLGYYSGDTYGGRVRVVIPVTPREKLIVYVGGDAIDAIGGYNGGGSGDPDSFHSFGGLGGGGASDVREGGDTLSDRIVVAAGGGGFGNAAAQTYCPTPVGGKGGNLTGATGIGGREGLTNAAAARPEVRRASVVPAALAAPNVVDTTEKPAVTALSVSVALAGPEVRAAARMLPPAEAEAVVGITAAAVAAVVVT